MRRQILCSLCVLLTVLLFNLPIISQKEKYFDSLKKGNLFKAESTINRRLKSDPEDIIANVAKAQLLSNSQYSNYNLDSAYSILARTKKAYSRERDKNKYVKDGITSATFRKLNDSICRHAMLNAQKENSIEAFQHFRTFYTLTPSNYGKANDNNYAEAAYKQAQKENTEESYKDFIKKFRGNRHCTEAENNMCEIAYQNVLKSKSQASLEKFLKDYPRTPQAEKIKDQLDESVFKKSVVPGKWESYRDFILANPLNNNTAIAEDTLYNTYKRTKDIDILRFAVDYFQGKHKVDMLKIYHNYYVSDGERISLDQFYKDYNDDIFAKTKEREYKQVKLADSLDLEKVYFDPGKTKIFNRYINSNPHSDLAFVAVQRMAASNLKRHEWAAAEAVIKQYMPILKGESNIQKMKDLLEIVQAPTNKSIKTHNIGKVINTTSGREYSPIPSVDGKKLYFIGVNRKDNIKPGQEDAFVSKRNLLGNYTTPQRLDFCTGTSHEGVDGISADGNTLIVFIDGQEYMSEKTANGWSKPQMLSSDINGGSWQAEADISSDGKAIIFSAERSEGYNTYKEHNSYYHGSHTYAADIYVIYLDKDNNWVGPVNLGPRINTRYSDRCPYLHPDMRTLYFSSNGHGGLGNYDVFVSHRLSDTCWTCWSKPVNVGKEINSPENELFFRISTDGEKAYFSHGLECHEDIYWMNVPPKMKPQPVASVSGKLLDSKNKPLETDIFWEDLETGKSIGQAKTDPEDGSFFFVLPMGKLYGFYTKKDDYLPISGNLDLRKFHKSLNRSMGTTKLYSFQEIVDSNKVVPVHNLFFSTSNSGLLPESMPELSRLAKIIIDNNLKIEISGHTDAVGTPQQNQQLALERAASVKDFLIRQGCSSESLSIVSYGSTKPVAKNDTEANKAKNRRVEIRILK